ncbi:hypothetical protein DWG95_01385 [Escherichia coli]|nr:hypothetical protein [Escherichia coli]
MKQIHDLTNRNPIRGLPGWRSKQRIAKAITIKNRGGKSDRCVVKAAELTPGGLSVVLYPELGVP